MKINANLIQNNRILTTFNDVVSADDVATRLREWLHSMGQEVYTLKPRAYFLDTHLNDDGKLSFETYQWMPIVDDVDIPSKGQEVVIKHIHSGQISNGVVTYVSPTRKNIEVTSCAGTPHRYHLSIRLRFERLLNEVYYIEFPEQQCSEK